MGRIRFLLYKISQLLPKGQRRPVILISSILGLFVFFQFMTRISDSYLLLSVQQVFRDTWKGLQAEQVGGLTIVFICAILGYGGYRYYGRIQTAITVCYAIIFLLVILPLIMSMQNKKQWYLLCRLLCRELCLPLCLYIFDICHIFFALKPFV